MGCRIGANCTAIFLCADDVILLAPSDEALQSLVDIVSNANLPVRVSNPPFCSRWPACRRVRNALQLVLDWPWLASAAHAVFVVLRMRSRARDDDVTDARRSTPEALVS